MAAPVVRDLHPVIELLPDVGRDTFAFQAPSSCVTSEIAERNALGYSDPAARPGFTMASSSFEVTVDGLLSVPVAFAQLTNSSLASN